MVKDMGGFGGIRSLMVRVTVDAMFFPESLVKGYFSRCLAADLLWFVAGDAFLVTGSQKSRMALKTVSFNLGVTDSYPSWIEEENRILQDIIKPSGDQ